MMTVTDQTGYTISLPHRPVRIISLVPSQTELLFSLGLDQEVVGITKFCVHPETWFRTKTRVGGTKKVNLDLIRKLDPDLVLANKEENTLEDIDRIREFCPVWTSDIVTVHDALAMISQVSVLVGSESRGEALGTEILSSLDNIPKIGKKAAYLIWKDPYMVAGGDTFIHHMMDACGLENIFEDRTRYPTITLEELLDAGAEIILLSSEPYPFKLKHLQEMTKVLPRVDIRLVDGEMFSWYGSRMRYFGSYIASQLADA